jgi:ribosomal protein L11 methyltransferase
MAQAFVCIRVEAPADATAEAVVAEAWAAGASGVEERDREGGETTLLLVYAPASRADAVAAGAAAALAGRGRIAAAEPVADVDWNRRWREGLAVVEISERIAVCPTGVAFAPRPRQAVVTIEPGQAFGTGGHASTRLALRLLDALPRSLRRGAEVLDVGTGSGVLALAALRLGAAQAVAFDLDPLATAAARSNTVANDLAPLLLLFTGTVEALAEVRFDIVVANLLRRELLPLLPCIAAHTRSGGAVLVSGLLAEDRERATAGLAAAGLAVREALVEHDPTGEDWLGLLTSR